MTMLNLDIEYNKGILFVRLVGKLDRLSSYKINNYLIPVILKQKIKYLVFNFKKLQDIDETGEDTLLNTLYAVQTNKGKLYLCEVNNHLSKKINQLHIKQTINEEHVLKLMEN